MPVDDGLVHALGVMALELALQNLSGRAGARDDDQARGVAVDPVDDARLLFPSTAQVPLEVVSNRGLVGLPWQRNREQPRWLVDDQQRRILVDDVQRAH